MTNSAKARSDERNFMFVACDGPKGLVDRRAKPQANRHVMVNLANTTLEAQRPRPTPPRMVIKFNANNSKKTSRLEDTGRRESAPLPTRVDVGTAQQISPAVGSGQRTQSVPALPDSFLKTPPTLRGSEDDRDLASQATSSEAPSDVMLVSPTSSGISENPSLTAPQYRITFQNGFCSVFFPPGFVASTAIFHLRSQTIRPDVGDLALEHASDAICALTMGVESKNRQWIFGSMTSYSRALRCVQSAINTLDGLKSFDSIAIAIYYLLKYETLMCVDYSGPAWHHHVQALLRFLSPQRLERIGTSAGTSWMLKNGPFYVIGHGLVTRKAVTYPFPSVTDPHQKAYLSLLQYIVRVPGCLEDMDKLASSEAYGYEADVSAKAVRLRARLHASFTHWNASLDRKLFIQTSIAQFPVFQALKRNGVDTVFATAYMFHDVGSSLLAREYWTAVLELDQTMLKSACADSRTRSSTSDFSVELEEEIAQCVDHLCQSLPYLSATDRFGASGGIAALEPLHFLDVYLRSIDDHRKIEWCRTFHSEMLTGSKVARILSRIT